MNQKHETSPSPVTRRDFLKAASAAAAGGMLFSSLPGVMRAAPTAGSDVLRVALVGCGGRGTGAASNALSTGENVKLVAMADAFQNRLEGSLDRLRSQYGEQVEVPEDHRFVGFEGYRHAIELADVVIFATPPGFRPMHFEAAVEAGKHVFMEKPVAVDAPGIRKVLAAAEKSREQGLKVGVGFQRWHSPGYIETIKRLQDGAIGDIVSARCYWNSGGVWVRPREDGQTEMEYQMRNWYYFNWLCGDHIVEQHVHNIDVINWAKDAFPVRAQGQGGRQVRNGPDHGEIFDHHFVEFEYADGARLYSQCRHQPGWSNISEHVQGTRGRSEVNRQRIEGETDWRYEGPGGGSPYQLEIDNLFAAIRNGTEHNEAEKGAKSTLTSILGRMCTYSNDMISWEDALNSELDLMPERLAWDANPPTLPDENGRYPVPEPGTGNVPAY